MSNKNAPLYTISGLQISRGYERIEHGGRGDYIEINQDQMIRENMHLSRFTHYYYIEYRTNKDNVKIYYQLKRVDYANYIVGKFYVSPKDVFKIKNKTMLDFIKLTM